MCVKVSLSVYERDCAYVRACVRGVTMREDVCSKSVCALSEYVAERKKKMYEKVLVYVCVCIGENK